MYSISAEYAESITSKLKSRTGLNLGQQVNIAERIRRTPDLPRHNLNFLLEVAVYCIVTNPYYNPRSPADLDPLIIAYLDTSNKELVEKFRPEWYRYYKLVATYMLN
jgi:hypothetical protein